MAVSTYRAAPGSAAQQHGTHGRLNRCTYACACASAVHRSRGTYAREAAAHLCDSVGRVVLGIERLEHRTLPPQYAGRRRQLDNASMQLRGEGNGDLLRRGDWGPGRPQVLDGLALCAGLRAGHALQLTTAHERKRSHAG
jgi:hypothetical protein